MCIRDRGNPSNEACAETLPPYQAFLQVDASLANADVAAAASPFGDLTGDGVADGVIMIQMVNLLPVNGYQFNFSLNPGAVDVVAAIDGNYLMNGGQGGLVAQMGEAGTSGTVIGFDAAFTGAELPASTAGQLLAVLVVSPALNSGGGSEDVTVTISDFVVSGVYNGANVALGACDADLDPMNGCFSQDGFTTVAAQAQLALSNVTSTSADLFYGSNMPISGFQLNVGGVTLTGASSGLAETSFSAATGNVVAFDLSGASLAVGGGLLLHIDFEETSSGSVLSINDIVLSDGDGEAIASSGPADADVPACANNDGDDICNAIDDCGEDPDNVIDCDGVCGDVDECPLDANDDSDGDGSCDSDDICPGDDDFLAVSYTHLTLPTKA